MKINGKVHCFFEQSGTFKNEFIKLGYPTEDYDIQNNFGQTDHVIDLFAEIEKGYNEKHSIFDDIIPDDLIIAFFPCIYFTGSSNLLFFSGVGYHKPINEAIPFIIERNRNRAYYYEVLLKLCGIVYNNNFKLVIENPYDDSQHFFKNNFLCPPAVYDKDRSLRGDYFKKPTGFWFINCMPTYGESIQPNTKTKRIRDLPRGKKAGLCSEERSMISSDYARNWICDFILGKTQNFSQQDLFKGEKE